MATKPNPAPKQVGKAAPTKQHKVTAPPVRLSKDPADPDNDGEAKPSQGKPGAMRPATFFARSAKKSGPRLI
jgi:hypothetical protein